MIAFLHDRSPWQSWKSEWGDRESPVLSRGLVLWQQPNSGAGSSFMPPLPAGKTGQSQVSSEGPPNKSLSSRTGSPRKPLCDLESVTAPPGLSFPICKLGGLDWLMWKDCLSNDMKANDVFLVGARRGLNGDWPIRGKEHSWPESHPWGREERGGSSWRYFKVSSEIDLKWPPKMASSQGEKLNGEQSV